MNFVDFTTGLLLQGALAMVASTAYCWLYKKRLLASPLQNDFQLEMTAPRLEEYSQAVGYSEAMLQALEYVRRMRDEDRLDDGTMEMLSRGLSNMMIGRAPDDGGEPGLYIVEYLQREPDGSAALYHRPLAEWPSWAQEFMRATGRA